MAVVGEFKRRFALAAAVVGAVGCFGANARAATDTFVGPNSIFGDNSWDTPANWSLNQKPSISDDAVFNLGIPPLGRIVTLGTGETVNNLTFNNNYSLQGGDLLIEGIVTVDAGPVGAAQDSFGVGATITTTLVGFGNSLTKQGTGTLVLSGTNTFLGAVTVSGGKLGIVNDTNLGPITTAAGSTAAINAVTLDGGILQLNAVSGNAGAGFLQLNRSITIGGGGGTIEVTFAGGAGVETANAFTGTGTLTKAGLGQLFLLNSNNFAGPIVVATNGGSLDVRASGALTSATSITINPGSNLNVDNQNGISNSIGIEASATNNQDRIANTTPILLNGGALQYTGRNVAGQIREVFGAAATPVTLNQGQSTITANSGGAGGEIEIGNLARNGASGTLNGGATVNFTGSGTLGTAGNNGRIFIDSINGGAAPANQTLVGGWATVGSEFAGYVTATGVVAASNALYTTGNPNALTVFPAANNAAADVRNVASGAVPSGGLTINSLNVVGTFDVTFTNAGDTLTLNSGGFLGSNNNHNIGTVAIPGQITAGGSELFFHINGSTTNIFSLIKDGAAPVTLVKDQGGTLNIGNATTPANNTYSGGTYVQGAGTLTTGGNANQTYLGTGAVFINNATLNQGARGATSSTNGYTLVNNSEVILTGNGTTAGSSGDYTATGDRYNIAGGSIVYASGTNAAGVGLNSLTRVATPGALAAGGNIFLAPNAIIQYNMTNAAGQGTGTLAPNNLGTAADLYFSPGGAGGTTQSVTVGTGTPYKGLSTDRSSRAFDRGTIIANSDFFLQGLAVNGGYATLTLGGNSAETITNNAGRPISATDIGNITLGQATPNFPNSLTFVQTAGGQLLLNAANSMGPSAVDPTQNAQAIIEAGGILNLAGAVANTINGNVQLEAGSRFLGDDNFAGGTLNGVGSLTFQKDAIFDESQANSLIGTLTLNWQTGSIFRVEASNPVSISTRVGPGVFYELFNGDRTLTNQATPENVTVNGGGFTDDSNGRTLDSGDGRIIIPANGSATVAGTPNANVFVIQEDFDLAAGATLNIGYNGSIAGNPKTGPVQFSQGGSRGTTTSSFNVLPGFQLQLNGIAIIPDTATLNLGAGASVSLNVNDYIETIGGLTGTGSVLTGQNGGQPSPTLRVGYGDASSTFAGSFSNASGQSATLIKIGTGTLTLTGASNAATRYLNASQGTVIFRDGGSAQFSQYAVDRGGTLTLDNQVGTPLSGRLSAGKNLYVSGGTFNLNGANVAGTNIAESVANFQVSGGGSGAINLIPGTGGSTELQIATLQARSISTYILNGTDLGAAPGAGNTNFIATTPNLFGTVATGTSTTAIRPDILSASPVSGASGSTALGFTTQDSTTNGFRQLASNEYTASPSFAVNSSLNVLATAPITIPVAVTGTAPVDTQIQSLILDTGATAVTNNTGINLLGAQSQFIVKSGGILVRPGVNATITTPYLSQANPFYFHTYGNLTVNGTLVANSGIVKSGPGTLALGDGAVRFVGSVGGGQFIGINDGAVTLGANNNSFLTATGTSVTANNLYISGGSLDVNGNSEFFGAFTSTNNPNEGGLVPGAGGTVTNSSATPATITFYGTTNINPGNGTELTRDNVFTGSVNGNLSLLKVSNGNTAEAFNNINGFTGTTTLRGGDVILRDSGQFTNTTSVTLDYANLALDSQYSLSNINNRLPAGTNVTLRGGTIELRGTPGFNTSQALGTVSVLEGLNGISSVPGQNGSSDLTIQSLTRAATSGALIDFRTFGFSNNSAVGGGTMGRYSPPGTFNNDAHITIASGLGAQQIYSGSSPSTINGFIGAWALVSSADYASYVTPPSGNTSSTLAGGIINFGSGVAGAPAYTTASATAPTPGTGGFASGNVTNINAIDVTIGTAGTPQTFLVGALRIGTNNTRVFSFANNTDILNIESGGLLRSNDNNSTTFGSTTVHGVITAGGAGASGNQDLYLHFNQNTATFNSYIADNGSASVRLIKDLGGNVVLAANLGAAATAAGVTPFSGGTLVNGGTLTLNSTGADGSANYAIPGNITINNATVALTTVGQIKNTATLAINNGGTLNLSANLAPAGGIEANQFAGLTFLNDGAIQGTVPNITTTSTTAAGTFERLVLTSGITSVNNNPGTTPTINGVITNSTIVLDFNDNATNRNIDVSGLSPLGLIINSPIANGALTKTGTGMLVLNGNTALITNAAASATGVTGGFTGGLQINTGQVRIDNANALSTNANSVTVGTGTADSSVALITNNINLPATLSTTLNGGLLAAINGNTTLAGSVTISAPSSLLLSDYYLKTAAHNVTLSGPVSGSGALTILSNDGSGQAGTLSLSNPANSYTGAVTIPIGATVTANSTSGVGNVFTTGNINLQGGQLNLRDNGSGSNVTLAYNNNINVTGTATLNLDHSSANTGNTFQFTNLAINNAMLTTQNNGNGYQATITGTTTFTGNATLNHAGGSPVNLAVLTGTGNFTKIGASQVNVTAASNAFTGGTAVGAGVLRIGSAGSALGTGSLNISAGAELQLDPTAGTTTLSPISITNNGLLHVKSGSTDFGTSFITGTLAPTGVQQISNIAEKYFRPADVGAADFLNADGDPYATFERGNPPTNAPTFLNSTPTGTSTITPGTPLIFTGAQMLVRGNVSGITDNLGASYRGTITVGGAGNAFQPGVISFGTSSDDGSSLYVDANQDGIFEASEIVVNNLGPHGDQSRVGAITLAAGNYDFAIGYYNGNGGTDVQASVYPGGTLAAPIPYNAQTLIDAGGTISATSTIQVDASSSLKAGGFIAGTVLLNGGASTSAAATINIPDSATAAASSASTLTLSAGFGTLSIGANNTVSFLSSQNLTGTLTKTGGGTLLFNGVGTGTGALQINGGTFGGTGSVNGPVSHAAGSTLAPGINGPGVLTIAGPLTLAASSTYAVEIGGVLPGNAPNNYDQTNVTTATGSTVAGATLNVSAISGFTSSDPAQAYFILTQPGTVSAGDFAGLAEGATVTFADGVSTATITYQANWTGTQAGSSASGGNDIALINANIVSVPEPASLGLLAMGMLGLLARRRRRTPGNSTQNRE